MYEAKHWVCERERERGESNSQKDKTRECKMSGVGEGGVKDAEQRQCRNESRQGGGLWGRESGWEAHRVVESWNHWCFKGWPDSDGANLVGSRTSVQVVGRGRVSERERRRPRSLTPKCRFEALPEERRGVGRKEREKKDEGGWPSLSS